MVALPVHAWQPWRFKRTPHNWWRSLKRLIDVNDPVGCTCARIYLDSLLHELGQSSVTVGSWSNISAGRLSDAARVHIFYIGGSLESLLARLYPHNFASKYSIELNCVDGTTQMRLCRCQLSDVFSIKDWLF